MAEATPQDKDFSGNRWERCPNTD